MRKRITTYLMIFSPLVFAATCSPPRIKPQTRCNISLIFNYGTQEEREEFFNNIEIYKDPQFQKDFLPDVAQIFGRTRCHQYSIMKAKRISEPIEYPLSESEGLTGFSPDTWGKEITPWAKKSIRYCNDTFKSCPYGK